MATLPTPIVRQEALEKDAVVRGRARSQRLDTQATKRGEGASTPAVRTLLQQIVRPLAEQIELWVAEASLKGQGRPPRAFQHLAMLEGKYLEIAYLTCRATLNTVLAPRGNRWPSYTTVCAVIGRDIEDECALAAFEAVGPKAKRYLQKAKERIAKDHADAYRRRLYTRGVARAFDGGTFVWPDWSEDMQVVVGAKLYELFQRVAGLTEISKVHARTSFVSLTDDGAALLRSRQELAHLARPPHRPMVTPPRDWAGTYGGGYLSDWIGHRRLPLIRGVSAEYLDDIAGADLSELCGAANVLQSTAWRINRDVYDFLQEADRLDVAWLGEMGIPSAELEPVPPRVPKEAPMPERIARNEAAAKAHKANAQRAGRRRAYVASMDEAREFLDDTLYFPHSADYRTRLYPSAETGLSPQGSDFQRALLQFANAERMGDSPDSGRWLAIAGANLFGYDKVSFSERVQWVHDNEDAIFASAANPMDVSWWRGGSEKSRLVFLAWCFEWVGYKTDGDDWMTRFVVPQDGTCNGLQHFAAMLGDPGGAAATNLVQGVAAPSDIYGIVASQAEALLGSDAFVQQMQSAYDCRESATTQDLRVYADEARKLLAMGIDRDIAKKTVMTKPYASSYQSCYEDVFSKLEDRGYDETSRTAAAALLTTAILRGVDTTVKAAADAMQWIQACAKVMARAEIPLVWTTPTGVPVRQAKRKLGPDARVYTHLGGRLNLRVEKESLSPRAQAQASSANIVHSQDAAHLQKTINRCRQLGIRSFVAVHDSFGTHATQSSLLAATLREVFVDLYHGRNVLEEIRTGWLQACVGSKVVDLPPCPPMGSFDVRLVLESTYFFS